MVNGTHCKRDLGTDFRMEAIELALSLVVMRLLQDGWHPGSAKGDAGWGGRPGWWWRVKLVEWAGGAAARRAHLHDDLRGLKLALRVWDDAEVLAFVKQLADQAEVALSA